MASSRSEENVNLKHFQHNGVTVLVSPVILWTLIFLFCFWQMLLPMILGNLVLFVADVMPCCLWFLQLRFCLAGVIAMLFCCVVYGDVITIRLML